MNQLFAPEKKLLPVPIPMIRPVICRFRTTIGTSKAMIPSDANASVQLSSQPMNGPTRGTMRLVKT